MVGGVMSIERVMSIWSESEKLWTTEMSTEL